MGARTRGFFGHAHSKREREQKSVPICEVLLRLVWNSYRVPVRGATFGPVVQCHVFKNSEKEKKNKKRWLATLAVEELTGNH